MVTQFVKTITELKSANRLFYKRVKAAQSRTLIRLANINENVSRKLARVVNYTGFLVSSINIESAGSLKQLVICSAPYGSEIEEGLKETREWVAPVEILDQWRKHKSRMLGKMVGRLGKKTVDVSPSPADNKIPHPRGVHFMKGGFEIARDMSNQVTSQELKKLNR